MSEEEEAEVTLQEILDFFIEYAEQDRVDFPGDPPDRGVAAISRAARGFTDLQVKDDIREAHDDIENEDGLLERQFENKLLELFSAIALLVHENDLDPAEKFREHRKYLRAIENAETVEELEEELGEDMADIIGNAGGQVQVGDDVSGDDYNPEGRDRDVY